MFHVLQKSVELRHQITALALAFIALSVAPSLFVVFLLVLYFVNDCLSCMTAFFPSYFCSDIQIKMSCFTLLGCQTVMCIIIASCQRQETLKHSENIRLFLYKSQRGIMIFLFLHIVVFPPNRTVTKHHVKQRK